MMPWSGRRRGQADKTDAVRGKEKERRAGRAPPKEKESAWVGQRRRGPGYLARLPDAAPCGIAARSRARASVDARTPTHRRDPTPFPRSALRVRLFERTTALEKAVGRSVGELHGNRGWRAR